MTGTDPTYISSMEHFESMSHEEIYAKTQQIDAGEILRASGVWLEAAATVAGAMPLTRAAADRMMNSMEWEGAAADAAYASTRSFADSVEELTSVMGQVGARLGAVAAAAEAVKLAVVPPGDSGPIGAIARLLEAAKVIDAQMMQEALRQEAVLAMNMIYKPAYSAAGTGVPALPEPPGLLRVPGGQDATPPQKSAPAPAADAPPGAGDAPESPEPPSDSAPPSGDSAPDGGATPGPESEPTPQDPPTDLGPSAEPAPSPEPVPEPAPSAPPTPEAPQEPDPSPAPESQAPPTHTEPAPEPAPQPAPPPPAPEPHVGESGQLPDPGGQPGVTGPIPDGAQGAAHESGMDQPGVIPTRS
ncbi:hypothetical protein IU449_20760 [Nocardia higoensis]|uniref:Uncharacterized protein n=1 Tax=Nocardia higoensis TaxID=228599 RepID=A0ABS0DEU9_9NOCA|nr:hypothetical protein [Nocardia higoensis]MBF6356944.1 hypothetical protein [Nocardia higoensis]